jgi:DNA-binding transcriptional regulator YhcF (GntR family)
MRRQIRNVTVTKEQADFIKENYKIKTYREMSEELGVHQSKVIQNARVMGLSKEEIKPMNDFDKNGNFDFDRFFECYAF